MSESFYGAGDVSSIGFFNEVGGLSLGVPMVLPAGTVSAGRWFYPDQNVGTLLWKLYDNSGTVLTSATIDQNPLLSQQSFVTFTPGTPVVVTAGTYWSVIETSGPYSAIVGFYSGGAVTRGDLTYGPSAFNAVGSFPGAGTTGLSAAYMTDIVFTASGAARLPDFMPFF